MCFPHSKVLQNFLIEMWMLPPVVFLMLQMNLLYMYANILTIYKNMYYWKFACFLLLSMHFFFILIIKKYMFLLLNLLKFRSTEAHSEIKSSTYCFWRENKQYVQTILTFFFLCGAHLNVFAEDSHNGYEESETNSLILRICLGWNTCESIEIHCLQFCLVKLKKLFLIAHA